MTTPVLVLPSQKEIDLLRVGIARRKALILGLVRPAAGMVKTYGKDIVWKEYDCYTHIVREVKFDIYTLTMASGRHMMDATETLQVSERHPVTGSDVVLLRVEGDNVYFLERPDEWKISEVTNDVARLRIFSSVLMTIKDVFDKRKDPSPDEAIIRQREYQRLVEEAELLGLEVKAPE